MQRVDLDNDILKGALELIKVQSAVLVLVEGTEEGNDIVLSVASAEATVQSEEGLLGILDTNATAVVSVDGVEDLLDERGDGVLALVA